MEGIEERLFAQDVRRRATGVSAAPIYPRSKKPASQRGLERVREFKVQVFEGFLMYEIHIKLKLAWKIQRG